MIHLKSHPEQPTTHAGSDLGQVVYYIAIFMSSDSHSSCHLVIRIIFRM